MLIIILAKSPIFGRIVLYKPKILSAKTKSKQYPKSYYIMKIHIKSWGVYQFVSVFNCSLINIHEIK